VSLLADRLLMQEEIDALLSMNQQQEVDAAAQEAPAEAPGAGESAGGDGLSGAERDALGEIGNISMGSAATSLSEILNQKVTITSPRVTLTTRKELIESFSVPYMIIKVQYTQGLEGTTVLVIKTSDAAIIADLMMGGDGSSPVEELGEMEISAAAEAMNQMMGAAATAVANVFNRTVHISPPQAFIFHREEGVEELDLGVADPIVVVSFRMTIGELLDTEIMQLLEIGTAKEKAHLLWQGLGPGKEAPPAAAEAKITAETPPPPAVSPFAPAAPAAGTQAATAPSAVDPSKLDLILDIPLKVTVVLGRTRRPIKEILSLGPGSIVELAALADEPVEILVNGTPVARGEVVVVNENFGVQITSIITPQERIQYLGK
jgi:flagellar motor switch protein FliN/FliY